VTPSLLPLAVGRATILFLTVPVVGDLLPPNELGKVMILVYHLPRIQAIERELTYWLTYFDRHPDQRFVSDGNPNTITLPRGVRSEARPEYGTRIVERQ